MAIEIRIGKIKLILKGWQMERKGFLRTLPNECMWWFWEKEQKCKKKKYAS